MARRVFRWPIRRAIPVVLLILSGLPSPVGAQRAPFATPPPGSGPTPMRPYGQSAGCSEEPAAFHRCATAKAHDFTPPRTPDGTPDLQGFWTRIGIRNMENLEEHPQTMDGSGGRSAIVDPPDGRIPYQPWAAARRETHFSTYMDSAQLCLPQGSPRHAYGGGKLVVQSPGHVVMLNDYADTYRIIPTDGRPHLGRDIQLFEGDLRGRWEGNTLVIDVTNQKARTWLDHVGNFYSDAAHVVERLTMIDKDVIHYQATIEDPRVYTRPWTIAFGWKRTTNANYEMWESACWEGVSQGALERVDHGLKPYHGAFSK